MASKDIFEEPFDEGTLTKLEIFEKYFEEWHVKSFKEAQDSIDKPTGKRK